MLWCWMFRRKAHAGHHFNDVVASTPASLPVFLSSLRCWMFRCSDVRCSAANLTPATISTTPLQASGFRLQASGFRLQAPGFRLQASGSRLGPGACSLPPPFDVGCSDVPMFDVLPQIAPRPPFPRRRPLVTWYVGLIIWRRLFQVADDPLLGFFPHNLGGSVPFLRKRQKTQPVRILLIVTTYCQNERCRQSIVRRGDARQSQVHRHDIYFRDSLHLAGSARLARPLGTCGRPTVRPHAGLNTDR